MLTDLFPELLSCIMAWGVELQKKDSEETLTEANHIYVKLPFPFQITISHVNSTLRGVALTTPALWTSIRISNRPYRNSQPQSLLTCTRVYIERSKNYPLQIKISDLCRHEDKSLLSERQQVWTQIIDLIMGQSLRWERFSLRAEYDWVELILESIIKRFYENDSMPMLTHMSLILDWHERSIRFSQPREFKLFKLSNSNKLTFLRLRGLALCMADHHFPSSLKVLHLDQTMKIALTHATISIITECCPSLEHLSVHADIEPSAISLPSTDNNLFPELRSLRIWGINGTVYLSLLSLIDTPKLTSLVLKNVQEEDLGTFGSTDAYGERKLKPFSQITSLSILDSDLSTIIYTQLFESLPSITNFTSSSSLTTGMASILYLKDSNNVPIPWPDLKSLTLAFDTNMTESKRATKNILSGRQMIGRPLSRIRMGVADEAVSEDEEEDTEIDQPSNHLNNNIIEEWIDGQDVWPADQSFLDEHDDLF